MLCDLVSWGVHPRSVHVSDQLKSDVLFHLRCSPLILCTFVIILNLMSFQLGCSPLILSISGLINPDAILAQDGSRLIQCRGPHFRPRKTWVDLGWKIWQLADQPGWHQIANKWSKRCICSIWKCFWHLADRPDRKSAKIKIKRVMHQLSQKFSPKEQSQRDLLKMTLSQSWCSARYSAAQDRHQNQSQDRATGARSGIGGEPPPRKKINRVGVVGAETNKSTSMWSFARCKNLIGSLIFGLVWLG